MYNNRLDISVIIPGNRPIVGGNDPADAGLYAGISKEFVVMYAEETLSEYDNIVAAKGRHEGIIVFVIDLQILESGSEDMPIAGGARPRKVTSKPALMSSGRTPEPRRLAERSQLL